MESSDDEREPEFASNYHFIDENEEPISFSVLPVIWTSSEIMQRRELQIDLVGYTDDGLQKFYKTVTAWKFDISGEEPEISVLCKNNNWIKLEKPRKCYQGIFRSVLVTVNFLHLVKKNPELNRKAVWNKLSQIFSFYDDAPSQKDLVRHKTLIEEAVKQDESLTKSECLAKFLEKNPQKKDTTDEDATTKGKKEFIVDDDEEEDEEENVSGGEEDGSQEEDGDEEPFDSVCCICDNGGTLLCCEGVCMRSFHATLKAAEEAESECVSLGLTEKEVKDIPNFQCKNCRYKRHQCFACGQLGSSDKSLGAEVFQCANATCGYFYHARCVAKLLHRDSEIAATELQEKITAGESFACPHHICFGCKLPEDKTVPELKMAVCRRCPKAYHEKCLPRKISFEDNEEEEIDSRAWRGLLVDRILIYCLKHEIDGDLGTPARNHIKFPGDEKKEKQSSASVLMRDTSSSKKKKPLVGPICQPGTAIQPKKKIIQVRDLDEKNDMKRSKLKGSDTLRKPSNEKKPVLTKVGRSSRVEEQMNSIGNDLFEVYTLADSTKPSKSEKLDEDELTKSSKRAVKTLMPQLDSDSERRILDLMQEASSIITMDDIILKHEKMITSRAYRQRTDMKTITQGKVQVSCEAVRAAIKKLDGGGSIEDAKNICDPKVLNQVVKWKTKLRVHLSPFLNGMRYTSFGRHFTKIDKLKEIVDKVHWYINSGDTIVDFCCGANDFSLIMKQKLQQAGKNCSYKNYDLFRPKNDFGFEKRDWLSVKENELPDGSQLVMGLNPPFGVKASLANQFIDQALKFKPKLVILIVPPETERLDEKKTTKYQYDLVWEDSEKLSGKSFYLPGSVDVNDKQMEDWNVVAPVLYLWSRSDMTSKHQQIAEKRGHLHVDGENKQVNHSPLKSHDQSNGVPLDDSPDRLIGGAAGGMREDLENRSAHSDHGEKIEARVNNRGSRKRRRHEEKQRRTVETFPEHKRGHSSLSNPHHGGRRSSPNQGGPRHLPDGRCSSPHQGAPHHLPDPAMDGRHSSPHQGRPWHFPEPAMDRRRSSPHQGGSRHLPDPAMDGRRSSPHQGGPRHLPDPTMDGRRSSPHQGGPRHLPEPTNPTMDGRHSLERPHHDVPGHLPDPTMDGQHSLERYSSRHQRSPSDMEVEYPGYEPPSVQPTSYDAPVYGRGHDRYQVDGYYPERIDHHTPPETDPFSVGRERWSAADAGTRPGEWVPGYMDRGLNQPPQSEAEMRYMPSTYTMGSAYSRMNSMPVTERYALRLDERNHPSMGQLGPPMTPDTGVYGYQGSRQRYDHMGFALGPANYYPHRGPKGGWLGNDE